jgi:hypothetical protein
MAKKPNIQIGDKVAYSANWLRSTGQVATSYDIGGWRGSVTELQTFGKDFTLATVTWHKGPDEPSRVNIVNLAKVGTAAMSAN